MHVGNTILTAANSNGSNGSGSNADAATAAAVVVPCPVAFKPLNDQVLVKLDVKSASALEIDKKPSAFPSGRVIAVGLGVFCVGLGYLGSRLTPGDHVALDLKRSDWQNLPLESNPNALYVTISESFVRGIIDAPFIEANERGVVTVPDSPWYSKYANKSDSIFTP